jgi:hypothetical protein
MLISQLAGLLPTLQQDPTPVAELATALLDSDTTLSFEDVLDLKPEVNFIAGLQAPLPSLNKVTLALLQKATTVVDVGLVAGKPDLVAALVRLWLCSAQTTVAEKARKVISQLLAAESPEGVAGDGSSASSSPTEGLMWRRLFKDRDIYDSLFSLCSARTVGQPGQLSKREKTIAQGRLLDLVIEICHAPQIWKSQMHDVEEAYGLSSNGGLLEFAAVHMVDYRDDVLIHMTLIDFFTKLVSRRSNEGATVLGRSQSDSISSPTLDFLIHNGLHERTMSFFLTPDQHDTLDATYLYSSSAHYISAYASNHEAHFLETTARPVLERLETIISSVSYSAFANNQAPVHDLKLLASLPQRATLGVDLGRVLSHVPTGSVHGFNTLAAIYNGRKLSSNAEDDVMMLAQATTPHPGTARPNVDQAAARALYHLRVQADEHFWEKVVTAAENTALKEAAIAAVNLIHAIVDSSWALLPTMEGSNMLSEEQLGQRCTYTPIRPLPEHGVLAVLQPPAIQYVMPYLMKGPENGSEAAWELAVAKHQVVKTMRMNLEVLLPELQGDDWKDILRAVENREREGPTGRRQGGGMRDTMPVVGTMGR